jgi:hypothetical protein
MRTLSSEIVSHFIAVIVKSRRSRNAGSTGEARNAYRMWESLGKRPAGRPGRWEVDVKLDLRPIYCEDGKWAELDRVHIRCRTSLL